jgi:U3 small nucleolar RNA-associated protein 15
MLDLYADQLGRSEEIDALFDQLVRMVQQVVDASQVAWSIGGMVELLTASARTGDAGLVEA